MNLFGYLLNGHFTDSTDGIQFIRLEMYSRAVKKAVLSDLWLWTVLFQN